MPQNWREYVYTGLLIATGVLVIAGVVVFASAVSFQGYITALMLLALAGCSIVGAREFKAKEASAATPPPLADNVATKSDNQSTPTDHPVV
jgi:hypothetical protein